MTAKSDELVNELTVICDLCKGKGSISMTTHDWLLDEPRTDVIVCLCCKGKGKIKQEVQQ